MMSPRSKVDRADGFTLVELLVSMALLSLLSVFTIEAIFRFQRISQLEASVKREQVVSSLRHLLQKTLSGARSGQMLPTEGGAQASFSGDQKSVRWINTMDDRLTFGGIYRLAVRVNEEAGALEFSQQEGPFNGVANGMWKPVLDEIGQGQFAYFGLRQGNSLPDWNSDWHEQGLPKIVKLTVKSDDGREDVFVIAVETAI